MFYTFCLTYKRKLQGLTGFPKFRFEKDVETSVIKLYINREDLKNMVSLENSSYGCRYKSLMNPKRKYDYPWESLVTKPDDHITFGDVKILKIDLRLIYNLSDQQEKYFHLPITYVKEKYDRKRDTRLMIQISEVFKFKMKYYTKRRLTRNIYLDHDLEIAQFPLYHRSNSISFSEAYTLLVHIVGHKLGMIPDFNYYVKRTSIEMDVKLTADIYPPEDFKMFDNELMGFLWLFRMTPGPVFLTSPCKTFNITPYPNVNYLRKNIPKDHINSFFKLCVDLYEGFTYFKRSKYNYHYGNDDYLDNDEEGICEKKKFYEYHEPDNMGITVDSKAHSYLFQLINEAKKEVFHISRLDSGHNFNELINEAEHTIRHVFDYIK